VTESSRLESIKEQQKINEKTKLMRNLVKNQF
jgi:hypothetical protein